MGSKGVILVVEDEPLIRLSTVDTLEAAGYEVIEAGSADAAIKILEAHPDIRLVFNISYLATNIRVERWLNSLDKK